LKQHNPNVDKYLFRNGDYFLKDKKAAKLIIKRAKKHPEYYTKEEVRFAKMLRKQLKLEEKQKSE
jgi:hypothetical protein